MSREGRGETRLFGLSAADKVFGHAYLLSP